MQSLFKKAAPFISLVFFGLAVWFLNQEAGHYTFAQIETYIAQIPRHQILFSLVLCVLSYLLLTGYDALAVSYVDQELEYRKIGKAGFIGYGFSHNLGMALLTGGSIRYRLYSDWGFSGVEVTKMVGFSTITLWLGFCLMGGFSLLISSTHLPSDVVPLVSLHIVAGVLLAMLAVYAAASSYGRREISLWKWSITVPGPDMAVKQVLIASADWLLASAVLYVLLPSVHIPFLEFLSIFMLAQIAGLFSQVPGGLGVFDSIMMLYLTNFMNSSAIIGVLLVYRLIYYIIPLVFAMMLLGYQELGVLHWGGASD